MTFGGVGGVVLLFWRGRGGEVLFSGGFGGACGCGCGGCCTLFVAESGTLR